MKVRLVKSILWFIVGAAAVVAVARFYRGLGASTAMTDTTPWGLWIGFDVLCGVALAAGGFVIAATVYVFRREEYHAIVRPAVLTAFLGYAAVVGGLLFDLGLPWNIWHAMIYWQPHSALFEVAWCVMLYLTVLALEFSPVVLEKSPFHKLYKFMKAVTLPLVIVGIMLSTLHQSSLGTLFLIMPFRLHPLWYSPFLPVLFFFSAVSLGLAMVCVESLLSSWLYDRETERPLLSGLAKAAVWVLGIYLLLRLGDLAGRGQLGLAFDGSWESILFLGEIALSAVIPMILFALRRSRNSLAGVGFGAVCVVLGIVLNRLNVGGIATVTATGSTYLPSLMEVTISAGVVSAAALAFLFFVENFNVYGTPLRKVEAVGDLPDEDPVTGTRLAAPWSPAWRQYSLAFMVAVCMTFALLPDAVLEGAQPLSVPVEGPRLTYALKTPAEESAAPSMFALYDEARQSVPDRSSVVDVLLLDADRDGRMVFFPHEAHKNTLDSEASSAHGGEASCALCHHMNRPLDRATSCFLCHSDMFSMSDTFDHDQHVDKMGGNDACIECHTDPGAVKSRTTAVACLECHKAMAVEGSFIKATGSPVLDLAPGYMDALHGLCVDCHEDRVKNHDAHPALARCETCHREMDPKEVKKLAPHVKDGTAPDKE